MACKSRTDAAGERVLPILSLIILAYSTGNTEFGPQTRRQSIEKPNCGAGIRVHPLSRSKLLRNADHQPTCLADIKRVRRLRVLWVLSSDFGFISKGFLIRTTGHLQFRRNDSGRNS